MVVSRVSPRPAAHLHPSPPGDVNIRDRPGRREGYQPEYKARYHTGLPKADTGPDTRVVALDP